MSDAWLAVSSEMAHTWLKRYACSCCRVETQAKVLSSKGAAPL